MNNKIAENFQSLESLLNSLDFSIPTIIFFSPDSHTNIITPFLRGELLSEQQNSDGQTVLIATKNSPFTFEEINIPLKIDLYRGKEIQFISFHDLFKKQEGKIQSEKLIESYYFIIEIAKRNDLICFCFGIVLDIIIEHDPYIQFFKEISKFLNIFSLHQLQLAISLIFLKVDHQDDGPEIIKSLLSINEQLQIKPEQSLYAKALEEEKKCYFMNDPNQDHLQFASKLIAACPFYALKPKKKYSFDLGEIQLIEQLNHYTASSFFKILNCIWFELFPAMWATPNDRQQILEINHKIHNQYLINVQLNSEADFNDYSGMLEAFMGADQLFQKFQPSAKNIDQIMRQISIFTEKTLNKCKLAENMHIGISCLLAKANSFYEFCKSSNQFSPQVYISYFQKFTTFIALTHQHQISRFQKQIISSIKSHKNENEKIPEKFQNKYKLLMKLSNQLIDLQKSKNNIKRLYRQSIFEEIFDEELIPPHIFKKGFTKAEQDIIYMLENLSKQYENFSDKYSELLIAFRILYNFKDYEACLLILLSIHDTQAINAIIKPYLYVSYTDSILILKRKGQFIIQHLLSYIWDKINIADHSQKALQCLFRCLNYLIQFSCETAEMFKEYENYRKKCIRKASEIQKDNVDIMKKRYRNPKNRSEFYYLIVPSQSYNRVQKISNKPSSLNSINRNYLQKIDSSRSIEIMRINRLFTSETLKDLLTSVKKQEKNQLLI